MFPSIVQIQIHLPCICVRELADFQINDNQATEPAMKESSSTRRGLSASAHTTTPASRRRLRRLWRGNNGFANRSKRLSTSSYPPAHSAWA
jgi:hypothetical protein